MKSIVQASHEKQLWFDNKIALAKFICCLPRHGGLEPLRRGILRCVNLNGRREASNSEKLFYINSHKDLLLGINAASSECPDAFESFTPYPLALVLGIAAVQSGRTWLEHQATNQQRRLEALNRAPQVQFGTIVVAAENLRYGQKLTASTLKEIPWPQDQLPAGAFAKISDIYRDGKERAVVFAIHSNEPILNSKLTGPGQRANLAAMIEKGSKAVTVRVDDVVGVAGFVLPGDRVDVLLTQKVRESEAVSDKILQNIKVLAIDQKADERIDKPTLSRSVTLEVSTEQAQRLIVAQRIGTLTLLLRPAGEAQVEHSGRITSQHLFTAGSSAPVAREPSASEPALKSSANVNVIGHPQRRNFVVPVER